MKGKNYLEIGIILIMLLVGYTFWPKGEQPSVGTPSNADVAGNSSTPILLSSPNQPDSSADSQSSAAPVANQPQPGTPPTRPKDLGADWHNGLTFEQAMNIFAASGYRYQLADCHGNPGHLVVKQG
ncbi:MAG: hypothetical protein AAB871_00585, partial [Patescibacteria group bacterium]